MPMIANLSKVGVGDVLILVHLSKVGVDGVLIIANLSRVGVCDVLFPRLIYVENPDDDASWVMMALYTPPYPDTTYTHHPRHLRIP